MRAEGFSMRTHLPVALLLAAIAPACVSAFPASSLDTGRSAEALPRGTTRVQVGGGGGAAPLSLAVGAGAGARVEHQFLDDLAVSADVSGGVQTFSYVPGVVPLGSYVGAQWNPFGTQWLALRARVGGGVDIPVFALLGGSTGANGATDPETDRARAVASLEPYASAALQVALSMRLADNLAGYVVPGIGVKQFLLGDASEGYFSADSAREFCTLATDCGIVDTLFFPGLTAGLQADMTKNLAFYVSGNLTGGIIVGREGVARDAPTVAVSPSANLQTGLAFSF
jgi:hypothetical protein